MTAGLGVPPSQGSHARRLDECLVALQALAVLNQRLSAEITAYAAACRHSFQDNEAWRLRCDALAKQLRLARGTGGADRVSDQLALAQLLDEAQRASEANALLLQPSDDNDALLQALVRRGAAAGWLIDASEVARRQPLGKGTFGTTYLATWRGAEVAVKCCSPREPRDLVSFLREVDALACVRHPNVLPFVGACLDQAPADLWLVTDFMPGGTLEEWIYGPGGAAAAAAAGATRAPPPPGRSLLQKLHMAWDVAKGMAACEALRPAPLAHRDLKPANVYIDGAGRGRVGDFGLAKRLLAEQVANLTGETGTYLYMSPEMVRHDVYGPKTDVWSWGVLLHELLTQSVPYSSCRLGPAQVALAVADDQLRPAWGPQAGRPPLPADVAVLGRLATAADPDSRPTFAFIVEELGAIIRKLQRGQPQQAGAPAAAAAAAAAQQPAGDPVATPSGGASWQRVLGKAASSARLP